MYRFDITDWPTPEETYEEMMKRFDEYLDEAMAEYFEYGGDTPLSHDEWLIKELYEEE